MQSIKPDKEALVYLKDHAQEFGIRQDQIMVGGESAGGGLCAAVCLMDGKGPKIRQRRFPNAPVSHAG